MTTLQNKVALITGSGRGIGRALALKLASQGARVVVNDLDEAPAWETVQAIRDAGGQAEACPGNVTALDFGERFVDTALKAYGGLDIIVSNAGYTRDGVIQKMSDDQFQDIMDVHVTAPFRILRAAAEPIRMFAKQEAAAGLEVIRKVVLISSVAGTSGSAGQVNYSAAKAAVIGMTKSLSKEWGRHKVCVNCVAFGIIDTRLTRAFDDPEATIEIDGERLQAGISPQTRAMIPMIVPLGRAGTAEEAAGGVSLFCGPDSDYISGQVIVVGGGV